MTKEGEKNNIIPLYFYKDENISAFPRLLYFEENINFWGIKKKFIIMEEIVLVILLKKILIKLMKK